MRTLYYFLLLVSIGLNAQVKPFPSAYGAGADTSNDGFRGGTPIHVTTLADDYTDVQPGTYRWAVTRTYPRIIIFDVSGTITLSGRITLSSSNSNMYIAGQTSPNGIMIRGYSHWSSGLQDVVVRNIQFYGDPLLRDAPNDPSAPAARQLWQFEGGNNILIDHCEFVYNDNEAFNFWGDNGTPMGNATVQNTVIGEGDTGMIMGADEASTLAGQNSAIRNLYVHISHRTPNLSSDVNAEVINNVIYNSRARLSRASQISQSNFYGNYYKPGSATFWSILQRRNLVRDDDGADVYLGETAANFNKMIGVVDDISDTLSDVFIAADSGTNFSSDPQPPVSNWLRSTPVNLTAGERPTIITADSAFVHVLANVGARKYLSADGSVSTVVTSKLQEYVDDATNGTNTQGSGSDYGNDLGNYNIPTIAENSRPAGYYVSNPHIPEAWFSANVPSGEDHNDIAPSGRTWMEEFLNLIDQEIPITPIAVTGIVWDNDTQTVEVGGFLDLSYTFSPSNATDKGFSLSSSNTSVVSNAGAIIGEGTATLTITTDDGSFTDVMNVTVNAATGPTPSTGKRAKKGKFTLIDY